ncbi:MAG: tetratricopeptide repeat protein [Treponema sp.]|jgi:tetratricopeptide (TPR) repeat protein|nr:tetratricopeptide repeat protein [Treponema sp.]
MPSLQALREFKSSFNELGGELAALREQDLPFTDLDLPRREAEGLITRAEKAAAEEAAEKEALANMGLDPDVAASLGLEPGPAEEPSGAEAASLADDDFTGMNLEPEPVEGDSLGLDGLGGFNIDDLLGSVPGEEPGGPESPPEEIPAEFSEVSPDSGEGSGGEEGEAGREDLGLPSNFFEDFPDDRENAEDIGFPDSGEEGNRDSSETGDDDQFFDSDEFKGFNLGGEDSAETADSGGYAPENLDDLLEPADTAGEEPLDISGIEEFPVSDLDEKGGNIEGIDSLDGLGDDYRIETEPEDGSPEPEGADALDKAGFEGGFTEEDLAVSPESADGFDQFNMDDNAGAPGIPEGGGEDRTEEEAKEGGESLDGLEDFTLQGFDDVFANISGSKAAPGTKPASGKRPAGQEKPEEISLDDQDLANLHGTLNSYPLNLRIACEEIIAEMVVPEAQLAALVRLLVRGAPPRETAVLAGKILEREIPIPRGFEKKTGEELEERQGSFPYIFIHSFLPVLRLCLFVILAAGSLFYLVYRFIYTPLWAESVYRTGYERIEAGEYERANERFSQAFGRHRAKRWFYRYAEAFRDQRQYQYAERKYDELLNAYPRDKKGALDYAALETYYLRNYEKADSLLRRNILDYQVNDPDALLALGDNALAWAETDNSKYEDARFAYARYLDRYGWKDPVVERMLRYFIRTDNLKEVLPLQAWFMGDPGHKISAETLAELGGYLLDKRTEETLGVPNEYVEQIQGVRDVLLRAVQTGPGLPEAHYHLSRYYRNLGNTRDEQLTLEVALRTFEEAGEGSLQRLNYHIEAYRRHGDILVSLREFKSAEADLVKAIGLYEDALARNLLKPAPEFGRLFAVMGDLEYFTKQGDMETTLAYYRRAEDAGWAPPEMLYRMGAAYYHLRDWAPALERFFAASTRLPLNRKLLLSLGNVCYMRNDYFAAQGYYDRLLDLLEADRVRLPILLPNDRPDYIELADRLMRARNNMGVVLEALTGITGNDRYRAQALGYYSESARAWDTLTRNPETMIRPFAGELSTPGKGLPNLNVQNLLYPQSGYEAQIFPEIDKDVLEPSFWEDIAPRAPLAPGSN